METNLISPEPETRAALRLASQVIFSCLRCHIFSGVIYFLWLITVHQVVSSLPLQMTLYFNLIYFPCWLAVGIIILFTVTSYKAKHYEPLDSLTNWECYAKFRWSWWWRQWSSLFWTTSTSLFSSLSWWPSSLLRWCQNVTHSTLLAVVQCTSPTLIIHVIMIWFLQVFLLQLEAERNFETFIVEYFRHRALFKHSLQEHLWC